jgi:preprotein translocase subunit SecF
VVCKSLPDAIEKLSQSPLKDQVEQVWVIGGSSIYKVCKLKFLFILFCSIFLRIYIFFRFQWSHQTSIDYI